MESLDLVALELPRRAERVDPRPPQGLVDVDVPHAGKRSLVEERGLHRGTAPGEPGSQRARREAPVERLLAQAGRKKRLEVVRLE